MSNTVSVCIPTYNGSDFLAECLDSVLAQTYTDFEVLVVDNCSTDNSFELAQEYAHRDSRVRVCRNETNLGMVGNWNRCLELAQGEWIKFVFVDDWIMPECLELMLAATEGCHLAVACNRRFEFGEGTSEQLRGNYLTHKAMLERLYADKPVLTGAEYAALAVNRIGYNLVGEPTTTLFHRSVFERYGPFNTDLIMSCDLEYWTRVLPHTGIAYVSRELAVFRCHEQATSTENRTRRRYRMYLLDNLVIFRNLLCDPDYAPLREAAAHHQPPLHPGYMLNEKAHTAYAVATHTTRREPGLAPSPLEEWRQMAAHYPEIAVSPLTHLWWRLKRGLFDLEALSRQTMP